VTDKEPTTDAPVDRDQEDPPRDDDAQGGGEQSTGVPANGQFETGSYSPTGGPGIAHWQQTTITEPGLDNRANIFFAAIEMTRMPMVITDPNLPDNPIVFANHAFLDLTGYEENEVVGRNCRFLQGARTNRESVRELREAVAAKRAVSLEILNYKRDGTPFWNACFVGPVFDKAGKLLYFFASQLDVTRRRTSEQSLRQAQKMEAIGQLTAGLAHDFNNLLQVVAGNIEVAQDEPMSERQRRVLDNAARAAERGAKLTRQLLAFARKTRLDPKPVNLNTLIVDFGDMLDTTLGSGIELELALKPRLPECVVDAVHLEMALLNILLNSRDAMPEGGKVKLSTSALHLNGDAVTHDLPAGEYVCLSVIDEGIGMPPHVVERATEPFFTTKGLGKGTGLGLAMAHGFVQQSLGRLEIDSEPSRGTTVRMLFPAAAGQKVATPPVPEAARPEAVAFGRAPHQPGGAETILVVEDSEDVLAVAGEHLGRLGYRVLEARSGEEALRLLDRGERIDALFSDIVMPGGINGLVLAERVRERLPGLPVLLTTGYNEDLVADGPKAPSMDVLGKPYSARNSPTGCAPRSTAPNATAARRGARPGSRTRRNGTAAFIALKVGNLNQASFMTRRVRSILERIFKKVGAGSVSKPITKSPVHGLIAR
jgi:PAS domain S-box-containing protein